MSHPCMQGKFALRLCLIGTVRYTMWWVIRMLTLLSALSNSALSVDVACIWLHFDCSPDSCSSLSARLRLTSANSVVREWIELRSIAAWNKMIKNIANTRFKKCMIENLFNTFQFSKKKISQVEVIWISRTSCDQLFLIKLTQFKKTRTMV